MIQYTTQVLLGDAVAARCCLWLLWLLVAVVVSLLLRSSGYCHVTGVVVVHVCHTPTACQVMEQVVCFMENDTISFFPLFISMKYFTNYHPILLKQNV